MLAYGLRRLLSSLAVVFIGLTITFFVIHLASGDPAAYFLDPFMGPEVKTRIVERFGLNKPLFVQYLTWIKNVLFSFDFGNSFNGSRAAAQIVMDALPPTLLLVGVSLSLSLVLGIGAGIASALMQGSWADRSITTMMLFFYSMPTFWLGTMILGLFTIKLNILPASQIVSVYHDNLTMAERIGDYAKHLILPVATLGLATAATFGRFVRTSMIEALDSDYVMAARARGIAEARIVFTYGFRNALIPLISLLGLTLPALFSGAVVIEVIFSLPGMGRVMFDAAMGRDYPVILATSTVAFITVVLGNILADIGYAIADPRARIKAESYS